MIIVESFMTTFKVNRNRQTETKNDFEFSEPYRIRG